MSGETLRIDLPLPADKPFDVVGLGVNVINYLFVVPRFPEPDSKIEASAVTERPGGVVATAMVASARLELRVKYVGKVGADDRGIAARKSLEQERVDVSDVIVDPTERTRLTVGLIEAASGRRTLIRDGERPARLRPEEVSRAVVTCGRILHLDGYEGPAAVQAAQWARAAGIPVSLDAEEATQRLEELLPLADILIVAHRFARQLTGMERVPAVLEGLARLGPEVVGVTLGADGSVVRYRGVTVHVPGFTVEVADTTGAGDVFHGAFLAGLVWGWPVAEVLRLANAVAALKCRKLGGRDGIPSLGEARAFVAAAGPDLPPLPAPAASARGGGKR
jgi:sugar/nucleoside kinase (ribokinase family)